MAKHETFKALRDWTKPEELLVKAVESFGPDIASWHDDYGNGPHGTPPPVSISRAGHLSVRAGAGAVAERADRV